VKDYLGANRDKFMRALTEKLLIYAMGRGLEPYDRRAVDTILKRSAGKNDRFSEVVLAIVASDPFRFRRGEEPKSTEP
jgi:predicted P-loop ATPase